MADNTLKVRLQSAYKSSADWDTLNPVLKNGEVGFVSSPASMYGWYKIGNGTSTWNQLPYSTYRPLNNGNFDTINVTDETAGDLIVTGAARFLNTIQGTAASAVNATSATSAAKLTTNAGGAGTPVYFSNGVPTNCTLSSIYVGRATADESGNNIKATYGSSVGVSGHTLTLYNKNGTSVATATLPNDNTDYRQGMNKDNTNKFYLTGTTSGSNSTATSIFSDSIYAQGTTVTAPDLISTSVNVSTVTASDIVSTVSKLTIANQIVTGSGTAARDAGSAATPRYFPTLWKYDIGRTAIDGDIVTVKIPSVGGHSYGVQMSIDNGTTYYPIALNGTAKLTTHFPANTYLTLIYEPTGVAGGAYPATGANSTANITKVWRVLNYRDTDGNDTGYYLRRIYPNLKAGSNKVFPYTIMLQKFDGKWESLVKSSSTGVSKEVNTNGFNLTPALLMYANATYNDGGAIGTYNVWQMHSGLIDHRYSFNTANNSTNGTTGYKPIYLVGTIGSDGLFYLDTTKWWTQDLPTAGNGTEGTIYWYIGDAYDYYRMTFVDTQKIYIYANGRIREYSDFAQYASSAADSAKLGGQGSAYYATTAGYGASLGTSGNEITLKNGAETTISHITVPYATSAGAASSASTAAKLSTNAGATNWPVYFTGGIPTTVDKNATGNALINALTTGESNATTADYYVAQYAGGGAATNTFHRRPVIKLPFYTEIKVNGNYLNLNKQGSTSNLTVPYATSAGAAPIPGVDRGLSVVSSKIGHATTLTASADISGTAAISGWGQTATVAVPSIDAYGHTTACKTKTITMPSSTGLATTAYVNERVANAVHFKGGFNPSNADALKTPAKEIGDMYVATAAGTFYSLALESGDSIIFQATVAANTNPTSADFIGVEKTVSVTNNNPTLSFGSAATVGTVEGVDLTLTMPSTSGLSTTDEKLKMTPASATKFYPAGGIQTTANTSTAYFSSAVYIQGTSVVANNFVGTATTATKAVQDGSGNTITSTYVKKSGDSMSGNLSVTNILGIAQTVGTAGGISLYNGTAYVDKYGIAFRVTSNLGKHGYVQGDWATYLTMDGADNRGFIFRNAASGKGNIASISSQGNAAFNGNVTIGANTDNTSGIRLEFNSTTKSLDFVFA